MQNWGEERLTRMHHVQKMVVQGQIHAFSFFGINPQSLKQLHIDFLNELRSLMVPTNQGPQFFSSPPQGVVYKGRRINPQGNMGDFDEHIRAYLERYGRQFENL